MIAIFAFIFGSVYGSFLNVLIYRMPEEVSVVKPRSFCPHCKKPIPWFRNIPLITFILQAGKCAECKHRISFRYPAVEALTGFFWVWAFVQYPPAEALLFILMTGFLTVISFVDWQEFIIPLSMVISSVLSLLIYHIWIQTAYMDALWGIAAGVGYLGGMMLLTSVLFRKQTMGWGDLQLIALLGAWLGVMNILVTVLAGAITALAAWSVISSLKGFDRERPLPFGPFLSFSGIIIYMLDMDWLGMMEYFF
ncbi:MAG: prepilin peptidase [FCB group bacterium]|nr:prepilin peptidase [FCB group bacterium]